MNKYVVINDEIVAATLVSEENHKAAADDDPEITLDESAGLFRVTHGRSAYINCDAAADFNPRGVHGYIPDGRFHQSIDRGWVEYYRSGPANSQDITTKWPQVQCDPHRMP